MLRLKFVNALALTLLALMAALPAAAQSHYVPHISVGVRGGVSMEGESREGSVLRQPAGEHAAVVSITSDGSSLHRVHIVGNRES